MPLLNSLKTDSSIKTEKDSIGSGGPIDSGLYLSKIVYAYITKASSEALGLVIHAKTENDHLIRQTFWMTSGKAKGGKNYFTDKNGEKQYLPGFNHANSLALLTVGKEISELETEEKVINVYSPDAKAEVPTKVPMLMDLLDKEVIFGLILQIVDKTDKDQEGNYVPNGETRKENEIDKIFRAKDKMTTAEIRAEATEPAFYATWDGKWTGNIRNKSKGASGTAGAPKVAHAATSKPKTSLFA